MTNVNIYAGDNYLPAADAKYNNLIWEEISGGIYIVYGAAQVLRYKFLRRIRPMGSAIRIIQYLYRCVQLSIFMVFEASG